MRALCGYLRGLKAANNLPEDAAVFWVRAHPVPACSCVVVRASACVLRRACFGVHALALASWRSVLTALRCLSLQDYGSLPQKPRAADDEKIFQTALAVMAYVYASPLSTHVLQLRDIPPRPAALDGCALACDLSPQMTTDMLRAKLAAFGTLLSLTREPPDAIEASVRFASHAEASASAAAGAEAIGGGAYVCLEYNERPFEERGWCVAEEIFSTECMVSLHGQLPTLRRPKIAQLRADGSCVEVVPEERSGTIHTAIQPVDALAVLLHLLTPRVRSPYIGSVGSLRVDEAHDLSWQGRSRDGDEDLPAAAVAAALRCQIWRCQGALH